MGGKSKSSTTANSTQNVTNTQQVETTTIGLDNVDTGVVGSGNTVSRTTIETDHGAISAALDSANESTGAALDANRAAVGDALGFGAGTVDRAFDFGTTAIEAVASQAGKSADVLAGAINRAGEQTRSDTADALGKLGKYGTVGVVVVVVAVVLVVALSNRRKS